MNEKLILLALGSTLLLGACETVKKQAGVTKSTPDEFRVVKRAPLTLPPDYVLRPPRPGAPRPQELSINDQAAKAVFGSAPTTPQSQTVVTDGESALLNKAGSTVIDNDIRRRVDVESAELSGRNKPVAQKLLGIGGAKDEVSASVVNAKEEAARLKNNAQAGKPVTEGETPSVEE